MYLLDPLLQDAAARAALVRQVQAGEPPTVLRSLKLKIISNCNLRCEMCNYWRIAKQQLDLPTIQRTLDHAAALGCLKVHLSGGEVSLHAELPAAIAHGASLGMRMNLTTNGVLVDKTRARDWIGRGLRAACLSLDGAKSKTHDRIRGVPGAFRRTVKAIATLVRENERAGGKLQVRINNVLSSRNLDELPQLLRLGGELGVADVLPMPIDGKRSARPSPEEIARFNRDIAPAAAAVRRQFGLPLDAARLYPFGRTEDEIAASAAGRYGLGHYEQHQCYAPYLHAFVSHTGDVFACCMTRERMPSLGNVRTASLTEIYRGSKYQAFRRQMLARRLPICANCDQYLRENRLVDRRLSEHAPPLLTLGFGDTAKSSHPLPLTGAAP